MLFHIVLGATVFISSACGLIIEIVAGRLIAPIFGMSLYTWTSIIAVVLAGLSLGHWAGGRMTRGQVSSSFLCVKIALAFFLSSATSLGIIVLLVYVPNFIHGFNLNFSSAILLLATSLNTKVVQKLAPALTHTNWRFFR